VARVGRGLLLLLGVLALGYLAVSAHGGFEHVWEFERLAEHRFTSMAMLTGTLRLRSALAYVEHDEQIYNGAVYTNWGYGVPLLQLPFHALARSLRAFSTHFFPDRAIFLFYLAVAIPTLWAALHRVLAQRRAPGAAPVQRLVLSWSGTALAFTLALFPLMSRRFLVYEETISYLVVFELLALSAYVFAREAWSPRVLVALGALAGLGVLIRPTGVIYLGVWAALVALESRRARAVAVLLGAATPFLGFWFASNWVKTGSIVGFGLNNSLPFWEYQTPMMRFGCPCVNTPGHMLEVAGQLFRAFFFAITEDRSPWLTQCRFVLEERFDRPEHTPSTPPFFGPVVLAVLCWILLHYLARRERRLALYVPFAAMAALFASFVYAGAGFVWRYTGDFWPLIVLACAEYVRTLPAVADRLLGVRAALALGAFTAAGFLRDVLPSAQTPEMLDARGKAALWEDFTRARWGTDRNRPSRLACGDSLTEPFSNGFGWEPGCGVQTYTNVFLGVPPGEHHEITFRTQNSEASTLRVYVNGRIYTAVRDGDGYRAAVDVRYERLFVPVVMATVEWTPGLEAPRVKLLSIELS